MTTTNTTTETPATRLDALAQAEMDADRYPIGSCSGPTNGYLVSIEHTGNHIRVISDRGVVVVARSIDPNHDADNYTDAMADAYRTMIELTFDPDAGWVESIGYGFHIGRHDDFFTCHITGMCSKDRHVATGRRFAHLWAIATAHVVNDVWSESH